MIACEEGYAVTGVSGCNRGLLQQPVEHWCPHYRQVSLGVICREGLVMHDCE